MIHGQNRALGSAEREIDDSKEFQAPPAETSCYASGLGLSRELQNSRTHS